jgi:hypothetical protein
VNRNCSQCVDNEINLASACCAREDAARARGEDYECACPPMPPCAHNQPEDEDWEYGAAERQDYFYDPIARAAEKQASRDADAAALASGEKTVEQLRKENGAFAFPNTKIGQPKRYWR